MEKITEQEANNMIEKSKEEEKQIIKDGGKVIKTVIKEKDKITTLKKIEPAEGKSTSSKIRFTTDKIVINH